MGFAYLAEKNKITFADETGFMDAFYELELETGEVLSPLIYSKSEWKKIFKYSLILKILDAEEYKFCN